MLFICLEGGGNLSEQKKRKAKCIVHEYYDKELDRYVKKGETIEATADRINYLIYKGVVEPIKTETKESDKTAAKQ